MITEFAIGFIVCVIMSVLSQCIIVTIFTFAWNRSIAKITGHTITFDQSNYLLLVWYMLIMPLSVENNLMFNKLMNK